MSGAWTAGRDEAVSRRERYDEITGDVHTRSPFWRCEECGAQNHEIDAECAYCDRHECYISGETWERFGRPDSFAHIPCDRCGVLFALAQDYAEMRRTGDYR